MSTQLPEPDINTASHINTRIVGYTADKVRQYAAEETKRLTAELQAVTAERDALKADAERYRWLRRNGNRFYNSINYQGNDEVLDAGIDEAMKGTS